MTHFLTPNFNPNPYCHSVKRHHLLASRRGRLSFLQLTCDLSLLLFDQRLRPKIAVELCVCRAKHLNHLMLKSAFADRLSTFVKIREGVQHVNSKNDVRQDKPGLSSR
jgi:hypothetical protein